MYYSIIGKYIINFNSTDVKSFHFHYTVHYGHQFKKISVMYRMCVFNVPPS